MSAKLVSGLVGESVGRLVCGLVLNRMYWVDSQLICYPNL